MAGSPCKDQDFFDADCMAAFTRRLIEQAHVAGNCVIVGRGSQCILNGYSDVFRVFVYAPVEQRLDSVRLRINANIDEKGLNEVDAQRARYIRAYFGYQWQDLNLYELMISSKLGDEITASTILRAMDCELIACSAALASASR